MPSCLGIPIAPVDRTLLWIVVVRVDLGRRNNRRGRSHRRNLGCGMRHWFCASSLRLGYRRGTVYFSVKGHVFLRSILRTAFEKVYHVDLYKIPGNIRRQSALRPDIFNNLLYPLILGAFCRSACRLIQLKREITVPERLAVQVVLLILLEDLASLLSRTLDLPQ